MMRNDNERLPWSWQSWPSYQPVPGAAPLLICRPGGTQQICPVRVAEILRGVETKTHADFHEAESSGQEQGSEVWSIEQTEGLENLIEAWKRPRMENYF